MTSQNVILLIEKCRDSRDIDSQVVLLREINAILPLSDRIEMPTFITDDYCRRALEIIEDRICATLKNMNENSPGHNCVPWTSLSEECQFHQRSMEAGIAFFIISEILDRIV